MLTVNPKLSTYHKVLVKRSQFSDKLNYQSREKIQAGLWHNSTTLRTTDADSKQAKLPQRTLDTPICKQL